MIAHYKQIQQNLSWIKAKLASGIHSSHIQKIYATPWLLAVSVRAPGKTYWLYQGRGQGWEGLWLQESPPPSPWRVVDRLLEFYRKRLSGSTLLDIELDERDRLIHWHYGKWGQHNTLSYYWQGRLAYLGACYWDPDKQGFKIYLSWAQQSAAAKQHYASREEAWPTYQQSLEALGLSTMHKPSDPTPAAQTDIWNDLVDEHVHRLQKESAPRKRAAKSLQRKRELFQKDLDKVQQIHLIKAYLAKEKNEIPDKLKIGDHVFKFSSELSYFQRRDHMFQRIKRLQLAAKIIQEKMHALQEDTVAKAPSLAMEIKGKSIFPVTHHHSQQEVSSEALAVKQSSSQDYCVYESSTFSLCVGLTSHGNDWIRKQWGKREDIWFHAAHGPSPHIILKWKSPQGLSAEVLQLVGSCLLEHLAKGSQSPSEASEIDLMYTKLSHVKGVPGASGKVNYKGEKYIRTTYQKDWKETLLASSSSPSVL